MRSRIFFLLILICILSLAFNSQSQVKKQDLIGVWKQESFTSESPDTTYTNKSNEVLLFSRGFYTNFETRENESDFGHMGTYKISGDTCFLHVTYATQSEMKNMKIDGLLKIKNDKLTFTVQLRENTKGIWVYKRIE